MKCPHCGKETSSKQKTPDGLLRHIHKSLNEYKRRQATYKQYHPNDEPIWLQDVIDKWQAWSDWVERQINIESEDSKNE